MDNQTDKTGAPAQDPANAAKAADRSFSQDDINRIVSQTIAAERKKAEAAVAQAREEAEQLSQMTAQQRAEHNLAEREAALSAREAALRRREIRTAAAQLLQEKGLPAGLADALEFADADGMAAAIDQLEQAFRTALRQGIEERMKGMAPAAGIATAAGFEAKLKKAVGIQ